MCGLMTYSTLKNVGVVSSTRPGSGMGGSEWMSKWVGAGVSIRLLWWLRKIPGLVSQEDHKKRRSRSRENASKREVNYLVLVLSVHAFEKRGFKDSLHLHGIARLAYADAIQHSSHLGVVLLRGGAHQRDSAT